MVRLPVWVITTGGTGCFKGQSILRNFNFAGWSGDINSMNTILEFDAVKDINLESSFLAIPDVNSSPEEILNNIKQVLDKMDHLSEADKEKSIAELILSGTSVTFGSFDQVVSFSLFENVPFCPSLAQNIILLHAFCRILVLKQQLRLLVLMMFQITQHHFKTMVSSYKHFNRNRWQLKLLLKELPVN